MNVSNHRRLGILGGQGALASAEFHRRFALRWAELPQTSQDEDYPQVLHWSAALPGMSLGGLEDPQAALQALIERVGWLRQWGADLVVMPCNSLHALATPLRAATGCEVLTPWDEAHATVIGAPGPHLVLGSKSLRETLQRFGPTQHWLLPTSRQAQLVDEVIAAVVAGAIEKSRALMAQLLRQIAEGRTPAPHVVLSCTELSCAYDPQSRPTDMRLTDTMDLLVLASAKRLLRSTQP